MGASVSDNGKLLVKGVCLHVHLRVREVESEAELIFDYLLVIR